MYILTFQRSKSKNFQKALDQAISMGAEWDGQTATLIIPVEDLLNAYKNLLVLFDSISKWSSVRAYFKGKPVPPFRFVFQVWNRVNLCQREKRSTDNHRH